MCKLSIIVPVYYNENNLLPLYEDLKEKVLDKLQDYEIVMVDDGSRDSSWKKMKELHQMDPRIHLIKLSRNFGSHAAILAGLAYASGDCAVIKAADLQEPSEILLEMFEEWKMGNNVVLAIREGREESVFQKTFSNLYYWLVRKLALSNMPKNGFDIFLIDRKVIEVLKLMDEKNSAITLQVLWSGFKTSTIKYIRRKREIGKSRWTLRKKIKLVVDSIVSFSYVPIRFMAAIGALFFIGSIIWGSVVFVSKLTGNIQTPGYTTSLIFQLFSSGLIMFTLGLLGEYMWRILDAARRRPTYIVENNIVNDDITKEEEREDERE